MNREIVWTTKFKNWLLVYRIDDDILVLTLTRTGTHSDIFGK